MPGESVQSSDVLKIRDRVAALFGIYFADNRLEEFARKLVTTAQQTGFDDFSAFAAKLLANAPNDKHLQALLHSLTVGETYFFREAEAIDALGHTIIPSLFRDGRRRLQIWSAGCATGEEPYSIAMFLHSTMPSIVQREISLLATDINSTFLTKAREAIYTAWSFRAIPKRYRDLYFQDISNNRAEVIPSVRDMVTFRNLNLAEDSYPAHGNGTQNIDIIFCRNVLMYFEPAVMRTIIGRFAQALAPEGWLVVSQTECCDYFKADFDAVQCGGITVYHSKGVGSNAIVTTAELKPGSLLNFSNMSASFTACPERGLRASLDMIKSLTKHEYNKNTQDIGSQSASVPPRERADLLVRVRQLADAGLLDEACARCKELLIMDELNFQVHLLHAAILQEALRFDEARATLRKMLYINPDYVIGYYSLGVVEQKLGNHREALRNFDTAARMLINCQDSTVLSEGEGLTAGRLKEFLNMARKL